MSSKGLLTLQRAPVERGGAPSALTLASASQQGKAEETEQRQQKQAVVRGGVRSRLNEGSSMSLGMGSSFHSVDTTGVGAASKNATGLEEARQAAK